MTTTVQIDRGHLVSRTARRLLIGLAASALTVPLLVAQAHASQAAGAAAQAGLRASATPVTTPQVTGGASSSLAAAPPPGSRYVPLAPTRLLDTRLGVGSTKGPLGAGATITLRVAGVGGVPATGVTAVVLNVTTVASTARGFVTSYPTGTTRPEASNLNTAPNLIRPNLVMVKLGDGGQVDLFNSNGSTHLLADVSGYYTSGSGSSYATLEPVRMLDTRSGQGAPRGAVAAGGTITLQTTGTGGVPTSGVTAVVLNLTAVGATRSGFVTAYPTGSSRPEASSLNTAPGLITPNLVVVKVGDGGRVDLFNAAGTTHLLADVAGYFSESATSTFTAVAPARLMDTRTGLGTTKAPLFPGTSLNLKVTGVGTVPPEGVTAVVLNVTSVGADRRGFVTAYPTVTRRPEASNLNTTPGLITPNLVVVKVGDGGRVSLFNSSGSTHLIADVAGYFRLSRHECGSAGCSFVG